MRFTLKEVADASASGRSMAGANFGLGKYRWTEHYISGRSVAGALKKWPEHSGSGWAIWKRILLMRRSREQKRIQVLKKTVLNSLNFIKSS